MLQLKIEAIKWETTDTATFFLSETSGRKINYKAGQFITLVFSHHDQEIRRSYSLSSSPDEPLLSITVKRIENGEISRFMLSKMQVGQILKAVEPAGKFVVTDYKTQKDIIFFAAGSGITPIFSQLKYLLKRSGSSIITLIYSSQHKNAILFKPELDILAIKHAARLTIINLISDDAKRLNNVMVEKLVRQRMRFNKDIARFYLCGPFTYMRMVRLTLLYMGFDASQIRKENFVLETVKVSGDLVNYPPKKIKINFNNELYDLVVGENQSILQAALQNNIQLPYSCRTGICSACAALCKNGKVTMAANDVLTDRDLTQGWILTCTGHPITDDVVISYL